jgi:hypothetical protein
MTAVASLKAAHPAECSAILIARITAAVPGYIAGAAAFNAGFARPHFRGPAWNISRPAAVDINIHWPIIVVNINVTVPPMEAASVFWNWGARVIPAAALAGFLHEE